MKLYICTTSAVNKLMENNLWYGCVVWCGVIWCGVCVVWNGVVLCDVVCCGVV